jgi:hypothetical protein
MFGSQSRVIDLFANRFEPSGDEFLFRTNIRAAGVVVSASERDRFVKDFSRRIGFVTWIMATVTVLVIGVIAAVSVFNSANMPAFAMHSLGAAGLCGFLATFYWLWYAPVRSLKGRAPATEARSRADARRLALTRLTWGQLAIGAATVPVLLYSVGQGHNLLVGWYRLWLVAAALLLGGLGYRAFQKLRASSERPPDARPDNTLVR